MKKLISLFLFFFLFSTVAVHAQEAVFIGIPFEVAYIKPGEASYKPIPQQKQTKLMAVVSKKEGRYFWTSRENKELSKSVSEIVTTYSSLDGSGYIKVFSAEGKSMYLEYIPYWVNSITYYGSVEKAE